MIYEIDEVNIQQLKEYPLTELLRRLLLLETKKYGILSKKIEVGLQTKAPDGGVDGYSKWDGYSDKTEFIPANYCVWQCKAENMTPAKAGNEVENKDKGCIKEYLDECLSEGANYILFTHTCKNSMQKRACENAIREKFKKYNKLYSDSVDIFIYDSSLIKAWVNSYLSAVMYIQYIVKIPSLFGVENYDHWTSVIKNEVEFKSDEKLDGFIQELSIRISKPGEVTRLLGLSGSGKTRIVHEAIRRDQEFNFQERLVFYDAANGINDFYHLLRKYIPDEKLLFIIDNCDSELHVNLSKIVKDSESTLLTIDSDTSSRAGLDTLLTRRMSDDVIKKIMKEIHPTISDRYLDRIVIFANGFPAIAVLLNKQILEEKNDIGNLNDSNLLKKLLGNHDDSEHKCLRVCSLFSRLRVDDTQECHTKFLAENIAVIDHQKFYQTIKKFEKRGLFERRGNYIRLVPRPLAVQLAAEWWEYNPSERIIKIVNLLEPGKSPKNLSEAFCEAVTTLSFLPKTREIAKELCGTQGPFGQAEMLKTEWGSKLFRAFVEIDPVTTTETLFDHISSESDKVLHGEYSYNIRRNYVWALEKLCFWKVTFQKATEILLRFAINENEYWGNNSTGQIGHLFRVYLSGTEASPEERILFLNRMVSKYDKGAKTILLKAVAHSFEIENITGSYGPTEQGTKIDLKEWRPTIWGDIFNYWDRIVKFICGLLLEDPYLYNTDYNLENEIISLLKYKRFETVEYFVNFIIDTDAIQKDALRDNIKHARKWFLKDLTESENKILDLWEKKLYPSNFNEEFRIFIDDPGYEYREDEDTGKHIDVSVENAHIFISRLLGDASWIKKLGKNIVSGKLQLGFLFGQEIVSRTDDYSIFFEEIFIKLSEDIDNLNLNVLSGALCAIKEKSIDDYNAFLEQIFNISNVQPFLIRLIKNIEPSTKIIKRSILLVKEHKIEISELHQLSYGQPLRHLADDEILSICKDIASLSGEGVWISLSTVYMNFHGENKKMPDLFSFYINTIKGISFNKEFKLSSMDTHYWAEIMILLLSEEVAEAIDTGLSCINSIISNTDAIVSVQNDSVFRIFAEIIKNHYSEKVDNFIKEVVISKDYLSIWNLELLFDQKEDRKKSIISYFPEDKLINLMKQDIELAKFFAKITNINEFIDDEYESSSIAVRIVETFPETDVLYQLSMIGGIQSFSGSQVPFLKSEMKFYKRFFEDPIFEVQEWAKEMYSHKEKELNFEKKRDEEHDWGIF